MGKRSSRPGAPKRQPAIFEPEFQAVEREQAGAPCPPRLRAWNAKTVAQMGAKRTTTADALPWVPGRSPKEHGAGTAGRGGHSLVAFPGKEGTLLPLDECPGFALARGTRSLNLQSQRLCTDCLANAHGVLPVARSRETKEQRKNGFKTYEIGLPSTSIACGVCRHTRRPSFVHVPRHPEPGFPRAIVMSGMAAPPDQGFYFGRCAGSVGCGSCLRPFGAENSVRPGPDVCPPDPFGPGSREEARLELAQNQCPGGPFRIKPPSSRITLGQPSDFVLPAPDSC